MNSLRFDRRRRRSARRAFTLIELLVVIAIIGSLVSWTLRRQHPAGERVLRLRAGPW